MNGSKRRWPLGGGCTFVVFGFVQSLGPWISLSLGDSVVLVEGPDFCTEAKLTANDAGASDDFGDVVAMDADTAVVGAVLDDGPAGSNQGSAYVFVRSGTSWHLQAKLTAEDGQANDNFGSSVAISADTVVVGAENDDGPAGDSQGSVYVFTRSGTTWNQQAKLTAADAAASDLFGGAAAIDGNTVVVGARGEGVGGSAYVFVRSGTTWSQQAKLTDSPTAFDLFGRSVGIRGNTALVGDPNDGANSGAAYVFVRTGTVWSQQQQLTAADAAAGDAFGVSVALSGESVVVGAQSDVGPAGMTQGSAYVFVRSGTVWSQQQKLTASDAAAGDTFGTSVAFSGESVVIGAFGDDGPAGMGQGSAYVFVRSGTVWSEQQKLTAADASANDFLGISVSISGERALVGAPFHDGPVGSQGSAYVFSRSVTVWSQQQELTADDTRAFDLFGTSVAVDGDTAVVGATDTGPAGPNQGSVYVFVQGVDCWHMQAKLTAADGALSDLLGSSVSVSGDTLIVGAPGDDGQQGPNRVSRIALYATRRVGVNRPS